MKSKPQKSIVLLLILAISLVTGCSNTYKSQKAAVHETEPANAGVEAEDNLNQSLPVPFINEKDEYDLMGLSIGDSRKKVIELYGEADECLDREVVGNCLLTDQCLYTYMDYKDKSVTIRKYFDDTKGYDYQNGIVEMYVTGGNYQTKRGIHIGSTLDEVKEKYGIENVFELGQKNPGAHADIPDLIRIRNEHCGTDIRHFFEYGDFEKIAYVVSWKKFEDHCNIPALIFLFHDDAVSCIMVINQEQWALT